MTEQPHGFAQTRARLDEIVSQVRKKDVSLEKSLDLLEEGVRLANQCTELIDHADWESAEEIPGDVAEDGSDAQATADGDPLTDSQGADEPSLEAEDGESGSASEAAEEDRQQDGG